MRRAVAGRGSNQYRACGPSPVRVESDVVAAEQVAWALNPEMDVWRDAGFDLRTWQQWVADGGTIDDVEDWRQRLQHMDGSLPYAGPVWYVVHIHDDGEQQIRVAADKASAVAVLAEFVNESWDSTSPKPVDERLAILRWFSTVAPHSYADVEPIPALESVTDATQMLVIETRSSCLYYVGDENEMRDELRSYVADWWTQELPDEPPPTQVDDDTVARYFDLMGGKETYLVLPCRVENVSGR